MQIILDNDKYEVIRNEHNGYIEEEIKNRYTTFFKKFDYIVGDWSYSKLRLKGFYESNKAKEYNNIDDVEEYIKQNCSYGCKYFILKKISEK